MKGVDLTVDEKQVEKLLSLAASKLGMSTEQLKNAAKSGNTDEILSHLDEKNAEKVKSAMKDKRITDELMKSINKNNSSL